MYNMFINFDYVIHKSNKIEIFFSWYNKISSIIKTLITEIMINMIQTYILHFIGFLLVFNSVS